MKISKSKLVMYVATVITILIIGWLDSITGTEVRILALYFLPLIFAGWYLGKVGAVITALFAVSTWVFVLYLTGTHFSHAYIWLLNAITEGLGFIAVSVLVALLRDALQRERELSRSDSLTGLANRRAFIEQVIRGLALCQRHGHPISMAYIDLDNFKKINDTRGHDQGDQLLKQCAVLIKDCVRTSDTVARLGGDEFSIFLPETNAVDAVVMIERIRATIEIEPSFQALSVTASIGVVCESPSKSDVNELLSKADMLMYEVKRNRKNAFVVLCEAAHNQPAINPLMEQHS